MIKRLVSAVLVLATVLAPWPLHSQTPTPQAQKPSPRVLQGRVISPEGRPLRGVRIEVVAPPATFDAVYSDETGAYVAPLPSTNRYTIQLTKGGYVTQRVDAPTFYPATPIQLAHGAAITGRVVDRFGDAAVGVGVLVTLAGGSAGAPQYAAQADDQGDFRIGSLPPGRYSVQLTRGNIIYDDKTASLTIPLIDSYGSTTMPREFVVGAGEDVTVALVHDAGNDAVQRGSIAAASFERDQERSARRASLPQEGGRIEGWVTDDRGRLARGAIIQLDPLRPDTLADPLGQVGVSAPRGARRTSSDAEGRYTFDSLTPGRYVIFTRRTEYGYSQADVTRGSTQVIDVRATGTTSVPLFVARGSAIAGTVVDRYGDAVESAAVQLHRVRYLQGRAVLEPFKDITVRVTDDRGHSRIPGVPPGQYYVAARRDGRETYYPGRASLVEAAGVRVDAGSDLTNMHVALQDTPATRVFGMINGATPSMEVLLAESVRAGAGAVRVRAALPAASSGTPPAGAFEFRNVPPGNYVLQIIERGNGVAWQRTTGTGLMDTGISAFATQFISVGAGEVVGPLVVTPARTASLCGRMRLERPGNERVPARKLVVMPSDPDRSPLNSLSGSVNGSVLLAQANATTASAFVINGVAGAFRVAPLAADPRWWVKSAMIEGVNAVDEPMTIAGGRAVSDVDVVLSSDAATVEGKIADERVVAASTTVVVFTTDSQKWFYGSQYVRRAQPGRDGTFAVTGLPPGDYHVMALDDLPGDPALTNLTSAEFLSDLIPQARRVRLPPSERVRVELPLRSTR
jgi:protocatechuate 3,4-dioxygenase beta subunit